MASFFWFFWARGRGMLGSLLLPSVRSVTRIPLTTLRVKAFFGEILAHAALRTLRSSPNFRPFLLPRILLSLLFRLLNQVAERARRVGRGFGLDPIVAVRGQVGTHRDVIDKIVVLGATEPQQLLLDVIEPPGIVREEH